MSRHKTTLTYQDKNVNSFYISTENGKISLNLRTLEDYYTPDGGITYIASMVNRSYSPVKEARLEINLGNDANDKPLSLCGKAKIYVNGELSGNTEGYDEENRYVFTLPVLGTDDRVNLIFKTKLTSYAGRKKGSVITNKIALNAKSLEAPTFAEIRTPVDDYTDIIMFREKVHTSEGGFCITYTLYNYGNSPADNAKLTDTFSPIPHITEVTVEGRILPASKYTYVNGIINLPDLQLPPAEFYRSPSGEILPLPKGIRVTVKGNE